MIDIPLARNLGPDSALNFQNSGNDFDDNSYYQDAATESSTCSCCSEVGEEEGDFSYGECEEFGPADFAYLEAFIDVKDFPSVPKSSVSSYCSANLKPRLSSLLATSTPPSTPEIPTTTSTTLKPANDHQLRSSSSSISDIIECDTRDIHSLEESFCRNFTCCGLILYDMHALLHHYEEYHVQLDDGSCSEYPEDDSVADDFNDFYTPVMSERVLLSSYSSDNRFSAFENSTSMSNSNGDDFMYDNNPLIRRIGDVEDDLGIRVLEWMHEEYERGGKRLKMMADIVSSTASSSASCLNPSFVQNYHHHHNSDEEVDVVTVDGVSEKCTISGSPSDDLTVASLLYDDKDRGDKPYRCAYPGCDKAYKNPNGLKYHNLHGHCGGDDEDLDYAARLMKPYVCNYTHCYKRYKNLNGLKYHIEKSHGFDKAEANQIATEIVKKTNARYGINARSVPATVLFAAIKEHEEKERCTTAFPDLNSTPNPKLNAINDGNSCIKPNTVCGGYMLGKKNLHSELSGSMLTKAPVNLAPKTELSVHNLTNISSFSPSIVQGVNQKQQNQQNHPQIRLQQPNFPQSLIIDPSNLKTIFFAQGSLLRPVLNPQSVNLSGVKTSSSIPSQTSIAPTAIPNLNSIKGANGGQLKIMNNNSKGFVAPSTTSASHTNTPLNVPAYIQALAAAGYIKLNWNK